MTVRIVAFLDVLGFSDQVIAQNQTELIAIYQRLIGASYAHTTVVRVPDDHRKWEGDEACYHDWEQVQRRFVNMMMASDSIVVFSDTAGRDGASAVIGAVYRLLREGIRLGMPLRGGIAEGELDVIAVPDTAAEGPWIAQVGGLVGEGLVLAHNVEKAFAWSGAVLDDAVVNLLLGDIREKFDGLPENHQPFELVPFVTGVVAPTKEPDAERERWVIDWPWQTDDQLPELSREAVADAFKAHGKSISPGAVEAKRENTLAFWDDRVAQRES